MKNTILSWLNALAGLLVLLATTAFAQGYGHSDWGGHHSWPDSLNIETFTGTVIVDSTFFHPQYFLDVNSDAAADYHLMFGPWWYRPESGAVLPQHGESITVKGTQFSSMMYQGLFSVMVFEINGLEWREPVAVGGHGWNGESYWPMAGDTLTVTGTALLDTTYFYPLYFLDVDSDSLPDYKLGFGPYWYAPGNGATRPKHGDVVTIFGRTHTSMTGIAMLVVDEINGQEWRPFNAPAPWAGAWMNRDHSDSTYVYCVNDSSNWLGFAPGNMGDGMGGMHGMMWPDSVFVQFWEIFPDSLPGGHSPSHFQGFYVNISDPMGNDMIGGSMRGGNNWGGHHGWMNFERKHRLHFRYDDEKLQENNLDENTVILRYWDPTQNIWKTAGNAVVDSVANTVTLTSEQLNTYYALAATQATTGVTDNLETPTTFKLLQNYPNPFNPETTISFELSKRSPVRLEVYNLIGQRLITLLDDVRDAGAHRVHWNGRDAVGQQLSSGIYLLRIQAGAQYAVRRMILLK